MVNICVMIRGKDSIMGRVNMPGLGLAGLQD